MRPLLTRRPAPADARSKRVTAAPARSRPAVQPVGVPRYLQRAAPAPAGDAAEQQARTVAAQFARADTLSPPRSADEAGAVPAAVRAPMEAALGADFGDVRVHADAHAGQTARALRAHAFTVGNEIAFAPGTFRPETSAGRELIAHELTHVAQQREGARSGPGPAGHKPVQRDEASTAAPAQPDSMPDDAAQQGVWRRRVDALVRSRYGIRGDGVEASQMDVVGAAEFGRRFPAAEAEETLLNLFLDHGQDHTSRFYHVLDHNRHPFRLAGATSLRAINELRQFIHDGIARGSFEGQTREYDVTTGARFPVFTVTPGELIAEHVGGITDIGPDRRSRRRITLQQHAFIDTLVHEVCHFYISNAFRDMARGRADGREYLRGGAISQILLEGFAEYFAQQVMVANADTLGASNGVSYPIEVSVAGVLVITLGEATVRQAYFGGDARAIALVAAAIDEYKDTHEDLLVPRFVVEMRAADAARATP